VENGQLDAREKAFSRGITNGTMPKIKKWEPSPAARDTNVDLLDRRRGCKAVGNHPGRGVASKNGEKGNEANF